MQVLYDVPTYLGKLHNIIAGNKTVYGWGAFGAPADYDNNRSRYGVPNAPAGSFIFDCSGYAYKAIPWGWCADQTKRYGGAIYERIPELETNNILTICSDVSDDFSKIVPGCVLYGKFNGNGHVGIYAGNGYVFECTTDFGGGAMITVCLNVNDPDADPKLPARTWQKHGRLPFISYPAASDLGPDMYTRMRELYYKVNSITHLADDLLDELTTLGDQIMREMERMVD